MSAGTAILLGVEVVVFGYTLGSIFVGIGHLRESRRCDTPTERDLAETIRATFRALRFQIHHPGPAHDLVAKLEGDVERLIERGEDG
jgi:hypothetical protein